MHASHETESKLQDSVEHLDHSVEKLDSDINKLSGQFRFWPTMGRAIVSALGAVIGTTIIIAALIYVLQLLTGVPVFGDELRIFLDRIQGRYI